MSLGSWGVIGLGWLGAKLSEQLKQAGIPCWGTTRKSFDWLRDEFPADPCEVLFLNIPPIVNMPPQQFVAKVPLAAYRKVIFISSISVYGAQEGILTEGTVPRPVTDSGKWLLAVERLLLEKFPHQAIIIRPGGLIGGERHPAISLSKSGRPCSGQAPVNLIHRQDLIGIVKAVAGYDGASPIINAVTPYHPSKEQYYGEWVRNLSLAPICFTDTAEPQKIIQSEILPEIYPTWVFPLLNSL